MATVSNTIIALIRTGVAALVGLVLATLAENGIDLGADEGALADAWTLALSLTFVLTYHGVVSYLERRHPWVGVLLGVAKTPQYEVTTSERG